ncbi:MAG: diguanylate cyclase [Gammaproteobacteria bacterium]|nr:diguanylate cyclase [Gammaproteobacteria bacterium]MBU1978495.1 diguanylate cyclase [Gammaproteobacteria bacterium]
MKRTAKNSTQLRQEAEAQLAHVSKAKLKPRPVEELLHDLQVHQIELEMQNEALRQSQIELEESRDRYKDFYDFAPVGYLTLDHEGMIDEINLTGAALLGVERNKLLRRRFTHFVAPKDRDRWHRHFLDVPTHDEPLTCELALQREDGPRFYARLDCKSLTKAGKATVVRIVLTDITGHKRLEESLREKEEFFRLITENVDDFIAVLDLEGRRLYNSPSYAKLFGATKAMKGTDYFAEIHPDDREHLERIFKETIQSGIGHRTEFRFVLPNGDIRHMESCGGLIKNSQGKASRVVVVSHDITARKQAEDEIRNLAFYDELTKLPNRRLLNDRLEQTMAASKRSGLYGVLMILDLDNFKPLNDKYGHDVGDLLLIEVAKRLTRCVREVDTVARFGGDEFMVILNELDENKTESTTQASIVAEKIRAALAEPYVLKIQREGQAETTVEHRCTSSIGVVLFINHKTSEEEVIKWADMAMYQCKEAGGNQFRFYDDANT